MTVLFGTNTFLMGCTAAADPYDFFNVRLVVMGAEALHEETQRLWTEKFGIRISEGYGLTETSRCWPSTAAAIIAAARLANCFMALGTIWKRWWHADGGLLCVRGANIMLGYLLPEQPGQLYSPRTERGLAGTIPATSRGSTPMAS